MGKSEITAGVLQVITIILCSLQHGKPGMLNQRKGPLDRVRRRLTVRTETCKCAGYHREVGWWELRPAEFYKCRDSGPSKRDWHVVLNLSNNYKQEESSEQGSHPKDHWTHHPLCVRRVVADLWATSMRLQQELTRHPTLSSAVALPSTLLNIFLPSTSQWMLTLVFCPQENLSYGFSQHTHLPACGCPGAGCMWDMEVGNLDGV